MRHGLTLGEMARMFDHVFDLSCDLEILPMAGWKRQMLWDDTGLRWAMPSPNMPFMETARVYPGQVIWEGTNVSEGRGTCRPFEIFGAPYLDTHAIRRVLDPHSTAGCHLQDYVFRPTFHKWEGRLCYGFMIHILDPHIFRPFSMSMALLQAMIRTHERSFEWKPPPYEYEYKKTPIDLIVGDPSLRQDLESGLPLADMERKWAADLKHYLQWRRPYLLYS
jgi:uncharacterized protein YbbC (DUF1343 family)